MDDNILGKRLRGLRDKEDIKQNEVAKKINISAFQLSRYESGKSKPDPELIAKFAAYYNTTTDYLLGNTDNPNKTENDKRSNIINKIATEFPEADLMFDDLASMDADDLEEVYEFIKFKSRKK